MSVNGNRPHVFVLPENDANRQLANGFHLELDLIRQMQVLKPAGGWIEVLRRFRSDEVVGMERNNKRFMILLIDFDGRLERFAEAMAQIPKHLTDRVFILGALSEPEALKRADLGSYETIGLAMAKDCREETEGIWGHNLLQHNASELARLREHVRPILFS